MKQYKIVVKSFLDQNYHHVIGNKLSETKAAKVERGLLRNMNMDRYYVSTVEVDEEGKEIKE